MPALRFTDPPLWRLIMTDLAGTVLTILDHRSTDRQFTFTLNAPAVHSGLVAADDPEINLPYPSATSPPYVDHNTRLVYGLRRETAYGTGDPWQSRYSGLIEQVEDVAGDAPTTRYTAYDPWQYLFSRPCRLNNGALPGEKGIVYHDARCSDIALDLLANTIAVDTDGPGAAPTCFLDITSGILEDTPVIFGFQEFERGISVGEALQRLTESGTIDIVLTPIYDPLSRPGVLCELNIYNRAGDTQFDEVFAWDMPSRSITDISRLIDGTRLANKVQYYAGQGGVRVTLQDDTASTNKYGDYWSQQFQTGRLRQTEWVEAAALAEMLIRRNAPRTISFSAAPEFAPLPLRDYGLGDYVPVWASRNLRDPIGIDYAAYISDPDFPGAAGYQRIYEIPIELDDNGIERVRGIVVSKDSGSG